MDFQGLPDSYLNRVNIGMPIDEAIRLISSCFMLGDIAAFSLVEKGYDALNIVVSTKRGKYIAKAFSKSAALHEVVNCVNTMVSARYSNIPVPRLLLCNQSPLCTLRVPGSLSYWCVMEYFDGEDFGNVSPAERDIRTTAHFLSMLHRIGTDSVSYAYDSWGTENLLREIPTKWRYLSEPTRRELEPIVQLYSQIDLRQFHTAVIHGDLSKHHVLRNQQNEYCIIDFGSARLGYAAVDLAVFLALYCIDPKEPWSVDSRVAWALESYAQGAHLSSYEVSVLRLLVLATYAIYAMSAEYRINACNDSTAQTHEWLDFARKGISAITHPL